MAGTPLEWLPWYNAQIHLSEFLKWANDDKVKQLIEEIPAVKNLLEMHMQEMVMAIPPPPMAGDAPPEQGGAGKAMSNSNKNSAPAGNNPQKPSK